MRRPRSPARPATPPPRPLAPAAARAAREEVGVADLVVPALAQRLGPLLLACALTAALTWWLARRTR